MRLAAKSAGAYVAGPSFDGAVHSVFPRAANLCLRNGKLVSLVASELGNQPFAYLLDLAGDFDFASTLAEGMGAHARAGVLRFEGAPLEIALTAARPWRSGLRRLRLDPARAEIARARAIVRQRHGGHPESLALARIAAGRTDALCRATVQLDNDAARAAVGRLAGFGAGLTPAGDDWLVGFLAGLWSVEAGGPFDGFRARLAAEIATAAATSNVLSGAFLEAAAQGETSERLADLVVAIARAEADAQLVAATDAALAVGASSGADGVAGLLASLDAVAVRATEPSAAIS